MEQYLTASGIRLNPLDEVQNLDCVADLVEFSKDPTKSAGGLLGPVAGCLGQQAKDPAASLTLGLLASALPQLSTQFTGLTGLAAGKDTAKITVTSDTAAAFPLGAWSGPITQPGARPFSINVTVTGTPGAYAATVEYPGLGCSGRWTYQGVEGSAILFLEQIDSDPQRTCVATVPIRFAPNPDGSVSYTALNSTGTLRRGSSTPGAASTPGGQGDAATAGWPTHRNDDGAGIRIWLGAAATSGESHVGVPKWISCKDASLCLAGSNQKVGLIGRRTGGYYTIAEFPPTQPAGPALAAAGVSAADIESLLR